MSEEHEQSEFHKEKLPEGVVLKEHSYDGIHEYDQKLPRWWLLTLYGAIIFAGLYWLVVNHYDGSQTPTERVDTELAAIAVKRLESSIDVTNNAMFWEMSANPTFVQAGEQTFQSICFTCHGKDLTGGIGFNLVDGEWVHGAQPSQIYNTVFNGVPDKGMQAWGNELGQKRIVNVVAYILSKNDRSVMEAAAEQNP